MRFRSLLPLLCLWLAAQPCHAHKVTAVSVITSIETEANTWTVELAMNIDPSDDPTLNDEISPVDAATEYAANGIEVWADQTQLTFSDPEIAIEDLSDPDTPEELKRRQVIAKISGTFDEEAQEFTLRANEAFTPAIILLAIIDGKQERRTQSIFPGESSRPLRLQPITPGDPFEAESAAKTITEPDAPPSESTSRAQFPDGFQTLFRSQWLTALFVAAFAFPAMTKPLIFRQLFGFAIAFSIGLCTLRLLAIGSGPPFLLPVLFALSMILLGVAILSGRDFGAWRIAFICLSGLVHGAVISQMLQTGHLPALVMFNVGSTLAIALSLLIGVVLAVLAKRHPSTERLAAPIVSTILIACGLIALS